MRIIFPYSLLTTSKSSSVYRQGSFSGLPSRVESGIRTGAYWTAARCLDSTPPVPYSVEATYWFLVGNMGIYTYIYMYKVYVYMEYLPIFPTKNRKAICFKLLEHHP